MTAMGRKQTLRDPALVRVTVSAKARSYFANQIVKMGSSIRRLAPSTATYRVVRRRRRPT